MVGVSCSIVSGYWCASEKRRQGESEAAESKAVALSAHLIVSMVRDRLQQWPTATQPRPQAPSKKAGKKGATAAKGKAPSSSAGGKKAAFAKVRPRFESFTLF